MTLVVGWMGSQLAVRVLIRWSRKPQTGPKTVWPGLALSLVVYGINMFGDALRDLLDPRLRGG